MASTDLFFVVESVNVFIEKLLELFDEPVLAYAKTEWLKYKDILTSADFSPLKCFSYSNAVTITKPFNPNAAAPASVPVANLKLNELDTSFSRNKAIIDGNHAKQQSESIQIGPLSLANLGSGLNLTSTMHKQQEHTHQNNLSSNTFDYPQQYYSQSQPIPSQQQLLGHFQQQQVSAQPSTSQPAIPQLQFTVSNVMYNSKNENNPHMHNYSNNTISIINAHSSNVHTNSNTPLGYQITPTYSHFTPGMTPQSKDTSKILQNLTSGSVSTTSSTKTAGQKDARLKSPSTSQITPSASLQRLQPSKSISIAGTIGTPVGNKAIFSKLKAASPPQSSQKKFTSQAIGRSPPSMTSTAHMKAQKSLQIDIKENTLSQRISGLPTTNHHSSRSSSAAQRIPNATGGTTFYSSAGAHKSSHQNSDVANNNDKSLGEFTTCSNNNTSKNNNNTSLIGNTTSQGTRNSINNLGMSVNFNLNNGNTTSQTIRIPGNTLGLKSSKSFNQAPLLASMNMGRSQPTPPLQLTPSLTMFNPQSIGLQSAALSQRSQLGGASLIAESLNSGGMMYSSNQGQNVAAAVDAASAVGLSVKYPQNDSIYNSTNNNRLVNIKTDISTIIENHSQNMQNISKNGLDLNKTSDNIADKTADSSTVPEQQGKQQQVTRRKARKETRKLSLEKYQLNIDAINKQADEDNNSSDEMNLDASTRNPGNKGFLQVMMNRFDMGNNQQNQGEKKRDNSPVNKRIGSEKIQDFSAFNQINTVAKRAENPFKHLITSMKQRLSHFKMDTLTLQLVVGKQKIVEETTTNRNTEPGGIGGIGGGAVSFETSAEVAQQERTQIKRDNLKRFSIFAKKENANQATKKADEQITQAAQEQQQLSQNDRKQKGAKHRDDKKKIIF